MRTAVRGVRSAGLCTTVHPTASAGAIFHADSVSGKFHGVTTATTPTGSRVMSARSSPIGEISSSSLSAISAYHRYVLMRARSSMPHASAIGLPISTLSIVASSVRCSSIRATQASMSSLRCLGAMRGHGPSSNARRAADTACSSSSAPAYGTVVTTEPSRGVMRSTRFSSRPACGLPSMIMAVGHVSESAYVPHSAAVLVGNIGGVVMRTP